MNVGVACRDECRKALLGILDSVRLCFFFVFVLPWISSRMLCVCMRKELERVFRCLSNY